MSDSFSCVVTSEDGCVCVCYALRTPRKQVFSSSTLFPFYVADKIYRRKLRREWELNGILFLFKTDI